MKFIPIIQGRIESNEVYERMVNNLIIQAESKASQITMTLEITDVFETKEYLNQRTMEDVLHSATSDIENETKVPIVKHITRKWMSDARIVRYEAAVQPTMVDTASKFLQKLESTLVEAFGKEVRQHFPYSKRKLGVHTKNNYKQENKKKIDDQDIDLEKLILAENDKDKFGSIYLEGMEMVKDRVTKKRGKRNRKR